MNNYKYKELITQSVIKELNDNSIWNYQDAMKKWWMVTRPDGGYRLTDQGDLAFRYAKIEFYNYDFKLDSNMGWNIYLLEMNNKLKCPYYIGVNKVEDSKKPFIRLYDSKIAMLVGLYGNINTYLKSIKVERE
jgi:hypothetical protein